MTWSSNQPGENAGSVGVTMRYRDDGVPKAATMRVKVVVWKGECAGCNGNDTMVVVDLTMTIGARRWLIEKSYPKSLFTMVPTLN